LFDSNHPPSDPSSYFPLPSTHRNSP
jgi:hypothetical protein